MKSLLLFPIVAALALIASSCRTVVPLDPMTLKQSCKCMPENMVPHDPCHQIIATK